MNNQIPRRLPLRYTAWIGAALMHGPYVFEVGRQRIDPDMRPCLQCGKPKNHNNSFCSAECCRAYKSKGQQQ